MSPRDFKMNGVNGATPSPVSSSSPTVRRYSTASSSANGTTINGSTSYGLRDTAQALERKGVTELGYGVFESLSRTSFIDFVEVIRSERLSSLPHKGGKWDKVLIRALYFAEQQHGFEKMMRSFGMDDSTAANLGYGYCKLLINLGHDNAAALDKAFAVLYKHSLEVAALLHRTELVSTTPDIREQLSFLYGDLLMLTSAVATRYYKAVNGMISSKISLDIYDTCGNVIESFHSRKTLVEDLIWNHQAQVEGYDIAKGVSSKSLKRWLIPSDNVQSTLSQDHTARLGGQADFTCLWFHKSLANFLQGKDNIMAVTGPSGCGKSVLAASIIERLQRSLGRQMFSTLFYSIDSNVPYAATPTSVLKSLLAQVFSLRLGNMQTYYAIVQAFERCKFCLDQGEYEGHLFDALEEVCKKPLDNARDLVIVVDGLDELQGGKTVAQPFFEKLAKVAGEGKRVKFIGFAQSLSLPSGTNAMHVYMTHDKIQEDLRAVLLKSLMHCRFFTSKPGPEQEHVLDRLAKASNGSFVQASLTSHWLSSLKSQEDFGKSIDFVEKSKVSVQDLVQRLFPYDELQPSAKTILSLTLSAERPLSVSELRKMIAIGPQQDTRGLDEVDIYGVLQPLDSLLCVNEGIIRFKHNDIEDATVTISDSAKITMPAEERQVDILLRILNYVRTALKEDTDPTFEEYDPEVLNAKFQEHPLLSYAVRYWAVHFQRLSGQKPPKGMATEVPNTSILPLMEKVLWILERPLPQVLELEKIVLHIRQTIPNEPTPALLQSMINLATTQELVRNTTETARLYYQCCKMSTTILGYQHPLPVEFGSRYLRITDNMVESKRTETMTHREEVMKILITVLERQYSKTSTQVIEMRTMLAQLYEHIHEIDRATEVYQVIQEANVHLHGRTSSQARSVSNHLKVVLSKSTDRNIETRKESIFDEEEETYEEEALDIASVTRRLKNATSERALVELWQSVSSVCHNTVSLEWHEKNIEVALAYSKFLMSQKRSDEASAILSSISREYESHQVSFSDRIVAKMTETAMVLKELGQYSAALSILKHSSQVHESFKKTESSQYTEIRQQISTVMTELIQSTNTESQGDLLEDIFRAAIKNESKPVDAKLMAMAKTLVTQYMQHSRLDRAIQIVHLVLYRTWPAFLSSSTNEVEMTTSFPKETIELVELMAQCYSRERNLAGRETTLSKLFTAILSVRSIDFALLKKVQALLLEHYDRYNLPDKAITVLQKVLPAERTSLGPAHEDTIKTLYELGRRSRSRPRTYPFWIDYYQQILTYLNADADICNPKALDAIVIVTNSYWEDGRYPDAVPVFTVLWNTFVQKPKEYPQFSQPEFALQLYERYYQCLEEVGTRIDTLYQITTQYRSTCSTVFGAQSSTTMQATLMLARICNSNERYSSEALSLYEEVSKHPTSTSESKSEIQHALSTLYTRQVITQSSTTVKSETVERALVRSTEQYHSTVSKFGYSNQTSLARLYDVVTLYYKQNKIDAATKELTKATTEIITKETSSLRMIEAAESIVKSFQAMHATEYCKKLVVELHRQIVTKDKSNSSQFGFDLTRYGRSVLSFLAVMEYQLSTGTTNTFSQLVAELALEMLYYEDYRKLVHSNANLKAILLSASTLRAFLLRVKRQAQVKTLENEVGALFVARDGSKMTLLSQASARIFMVAIMQYLAHHPSAAFIKAVILASNDSLEHLMAEGQYAEAYDIAHCAFEFALENDGYTGPKGISHGFNLASTLAGIGYSRKCSDATLRQKMLQLSNQIAKGIIDVCRKQDIDFAEIQIRELNRLVVLLGEQEDYETLEWLLTTLWSTRTAQRTWSSHVLHNLGRNLVSARNMAGHPIKAVRLCEDIAYNLRRTNGATHPKTRDMTELLAQLYTSAGNWYIQHGGKDKSSIDLANQYFAKAIGVHEEMLRTLVRGNSNGVMGDDDDDEDSTGAILAQHGIVVSDGAATNGAASSSADLGAMAKAHTRLLKLAYQRLGSWPKSASEYEQLVAQVQQTFPSETKDIQGMDKWQVKGFGSGKAESGDGAFGKVENWQLVEA